MKNKKPKKVRLFRLTDKGVEEMTTNEDERKVNFELMKKVSLPNHEILDKIKQLGIYEVPESIKSMQNIALPNYEIFDKIKQLKIYEAPESIKSMQNTALPNYEIFDKIKQLKIYEVPESIKSMQNIALPKPYLPFINPIYEYGKSIQKIIKKCISPEFVETFHSIKNLAEEVIKEKEEAENNLWYNLTINDYKLESKKDKDKISELEQKIIELEKTLTYKILASIQEPIKRTSKKEPIKQLSPCITPIEILRLHNKLQDVFIATLKQWKMLFSEKEIILPEPIKVNAISDVSLLLVLLYQNKKIGAKNYASIIGRVKAFTLNNKPITAKQLNATKERSNWWQVEPPLVIGYNWEKINEAVANM